MIEDPLLKKVKPFDFRRVRRLSFTLEKKLDEVNLRFSQNLTRLFSALAGEGKEGILVSPHRTESEPADVEKSAEEFDFVFQIEPGEQGRLMLEKNLASGLLCLYLGYPEGERSSSTKLTRIEEEALSQLVKDMLAELQNAWAEDLKIGELTRGKGEGSGDELVVSRFSVEPGTTSGKMRIGYPVHVLEKSHTGDSSSRIESREKIRELIEGSEVELACVLGKPETHSHASLRLTLNQIAELKPGYIILMDKEGDSEVTLSIQEKNKFRGLAGSYKDKLGVQIVSAFS